MKLNARRRIIIPFLFLVMIPVMFVCAFFYMNQRSMYIDDQIEITENRLNDLIELIKNYEYNSTNRTFVLSYIESLEIEQLYIIENEKIIYSTVDIPQVDDGRLIGAVDETSQIKDYDLKFKVFNQWDWKICILTSTHVKPLQVLKIDGAVIGVGIIFILFSIEAIILITDNFYKPVKILLNGYNDIISGNYQSEIDIDSEGEMGMLGMAFNDMKNTIAHRTNKAIQMRRLADDILSSISTGIITTDTEGRIVKYNTAAANMIGFEHESFDEDYDVMVVRALVAQITKTLKTKQTINEMVQFTEHHTSESVYYDITTSVMENDLGQITGAICSFNDISQRKRIEERIERLDRMASLGQLSAGLAHEIRNPLSGMKMSTQVLHGRLKHHLNDAEERMFMANIKEIDRLNKLITELLEFSKPQTPNIQSVGVNDVLTHTLQFVQKNMSDKKIELSISGMDKKTCVLFDENQMSQIFMNIISNAIEAMQVGGRLEITCNEEILHGERFVAVRFKDNGCGIDEENLKQVFDPFFTTRSTGTGLGLSVVHRLITANYGEIDVTSRVGEGTIFTIYMLGDERSI